MEPTSSGNRNAPVQMERFLRPDTYIDFDAPAVQTILPTLFAPGMTAIEQAKTAYEYVRDCILHSFDCNAAVVTAKASDVLLYGTGICFAKANLLAALLRSQSIPTGLCYQRLTLHDEDDSLGYCIHAYNAVFLEGRWVKLDARGNKPGVDAQFSLGAPRLAYPVRPAYDEYHVPGIYARPYAPMMRVLEQASCLQDVYDGLPDRIETAPDLPA